ncbi:hypothetical protein FB639_005316, partial [Coemansia asiatica]
HIEQLQDGQIEPLGGHSDQSRYRHSGRSPTAAASMRDIDANTHPTQQQSRRHYPSSSVAGVSPPAPQRIARMRLPEYSNLTNHMASQSPRPLLYPRHSNNNSMTENGVMRHATLSGSNRHRSSSRIRISSHMPSAASPALPFQRNSTTSSG